MTVIELIDELKKWPADAKVETCYDGACYQPLESDMIRARKHKFTGVENPGTVVLHCEW